MCAREYGSLIRSARDLYKADYVLGDDIFTVLKSHVAVLWLIYCAMR